MVIPCPVERQRHFVMVDFERYQRHIHHVKSIFDTVIRLLIESFRTMPKNTKHEPTFLNFQGLKIRCQNSCPN